MAAVAMLLCSCIHNDIPYARIQANFISLEAIGQDAGTQIDSASRTATITLPEEIDIQNVRISGYSITPGASIVNNPLTGPINLSSPLTVTLRLYQDWNWSIIGKQTIERYFEVVGQMGQTVIDAPGRRVVVYVRESSDLSAIEIVRAKLGPTGAEYSPSIAPGSKFDARKPFNINVEEYGRKYSWTIYVETVDVAVRTVGADAWTCVAWVYGQAEAGLDNGVEYRLASQTEWTRLPSSAINTPSVASDGLCGTHILRLRHRRRSIVHYRRGHTAPERRFRPMVARW